MKIKLKGHLGKVFTSHSNVNPRSTLRFELYLASDEQVLALQNARNQQVAVTVEFEVKEEFQACSVCGDFRINRYSHPTMEVKEVGVLRKRWRFHCTLCKTIVLIYADSREEAVSHYNRGRC